MVIDSSYILLVTIGGFLISQSGYQAGKHKQWFRFDVLALQVIGYAIIRSAVGLP